VSAPLWEGLESSIDELRVFCRKNDDVRKLIDRQVEESNALGTNRHSSNRNTIAKHPDTVLGKLKRLKRDNPELFEEVVLGKMSANAAAIRAGFRKKPTPFEIILKQLPNLSPDERSELRSML
jgi:hypothetical protein